jgi:predicted RNA-binding Zn-ribbon protein involved in translation (DUF1610 family)
MANVQRSGGEFQVQKPELHPCPRCGSHEISTGIPFNQGVEVGPFGLLYKALGILRGTERVYADLCLSCGEIVRLYVRNTKRKWDCSD